MKPSGGTLHSALCTLHSVPIFWQHAWCVYIYIYNIPQSHYWHLYLINTPWCLNSMSSMENLLLTFAYLLYVFYWQITPCLIIFNKFKLLEHPLPYPVPKQPRWQELCSSNISWYLDQMKPLKTWAILENATLVGINKFL